MNVGQLEITLGLKTNVYMFYFAACSVLRRKQMRAAQRQNLWGHLQATMLK